jgi:hypothetical protein
MSDHPKDTAGETPIERALRLKKAALQAKPERPGGGKAQLRPTAGIAAGASKPSMRK